MSRRAIIVVLDSVGAGELRDASNYGDAGTNTLAHVATAVGGLNLPTLQRLGLGNILSIGGVDPVEHPDACFGKMMERSAGKDTTTGHWEISGVITEDPFPVFPNGFPAEVIQPFEQAIGRGTIGNIAASGTEIIAALGEEHIATGRPIVYTSADSVFQIAAHEDVVPLEVLYEWCRIARRQLTGRNGVARVIARPFAGEVGSFVRTPRRRDFSIEPPYPTLLDAITESGRTVYGIGKIEDLFAGRGISRAVHPPDNDAVMDATIAAVREGRDTLVFSNLVDFDTLYGHRNDAEGYARALESFDRELPVLIDSLHEEDMLIITADHGCDPTTPGTDHTREHVPLIVTGNRVRAGVDLGVRGTFSDIAASVSKWLSISQVGPGKSFLEDILS